MRSRPLIAALLLCAHCATLHAPLENMRDRAGRCRDSAGRFATDSSCDSAISPTDGTLAALGVLLGLGLTAVIIYVASRPRSQAPEPVAPSAPASAAPGDEAAREAALLRAQPRVIVFRDAGTDASHDAGRDAGMMVLLSCYDREGNHTPRLGYSCEQEGLFRTPPARTDTRLHWLGPSGGGR
jgi:hypothetical protein